MTYLKKIGTVFTALAALATANGCASDELETGDYLVFRVAFATSTPDASCYTNGEIPMSIVEDSSSLRSGGTFIMYAAEEGGLYLDTGNMVLEGAKEGDVYEFEGAVVDVEFPPGSTIFDSDHDGIDDDVDPLVDANGNGIDDSQEEFIDMDGDGLDDRYEDDIVDANMDGKDDRIVELPAGYKFKDSREYDFEISIFDDVVQGETKTTIRSSCEGMGCPLEYGAKCTVKGEFEGVIIEDAQVDVSLGAPTEDGSPSSNNSSNNGS